MTTAHIVTLGCARNESDSEELAGRLQASGYEFVTDPADAEVLLVNTCGFIEAAKKDSIDTLLAALEVRDTPGTATRQVIAVGCMAQRYHDELVAEMPELDSVLTFDEYANIGPRLGGDARSVAPGGFGGREGVGSARAGAMGEVFPNVFRARLGDSPYAPLKIASGCERRCAFCAIPAIRGSYVSRPLDDVVAEAQWLVTQGVREVMLVSENTTSYGKDLRDRDALETLLARLNRVDGLEWIRASYLQPAELRPSLIGAILDLPKVVPYFDLSFQHASASVLKRMRRFGDPESFLSLIDGIRSRCPQAGLRTNVIVGFPGETRDDVRTLHDFLSAATFDTIGVFGYSDEEGTEAYSLDGHIDDEEIAQRVRETSELAEWLCNERAATRIGESVSVLVESADGLGRAAHQGPEVDGSSQLTSGTDWVPGSIVPGVVVATDGVDLLIDPIR
ncbi:MAG: 30S ribosomal protein S12 methylthiotransferase RimO [Propionibacteriaceae bacterium]|jgi:ribosomal protein S12 methylthiotransferase RimO|nr:30S ribosomal protein S12 methylthiotransferase RimO [Propionibacteriaceae bacterium]